MQLKSVLTMICAVLLATAAVWGIGRASDEQHRAAEIAALALQR